MVEGRGAQGLSLCEGRVCWTPVGPEGPGWLAPAL